MEMVTFTIIVDDIVYPDGHSAMACLGGGGPQTAFGAKLWFSDNERVGLAAGIGADFPESCRTWLEETGIDTHGLLQWPLSTLRAWQILEEDGRRTQVWRMAVGDEVWGMLRPEMSALPLPYQDLVSSGHIFSPNEKEAVSLVGPGPPLELIERLSELGAEVVVLRRGPLGCIVHRRRLMMKHQLRRNQHSGSRG
ncbi:hypothetical protein BDL97_16G022000 [Sphagnum fallax]|nr:hypothetical protein BDL97_16G022000 [Sphagnum fallax]